MKEHIPIRRVTASAADGYIYIYDADNACGLSVRYLVDSAPNRIFNTNVICKQVCGGLYCRLAQ